MGSRLNGKGLIGIGLCSIAILSISSKRKRRSDPSVTSPATTPHQEADGRSYSFTRKEEPNYIDKLVADSPCPGTFYRSKAGDTVESICASAISSLSGQNEFGRISSGLNSYIQAVIFSQWNMMTWSAPSCHALSGIAQNSSIELRPEHEDNYRLMRMGMPPSGGPGENYPLIWLPMFNEDIYESSGDISTEGIFHDETIGGVSFSATNPPGSIMSLGVNPTPRDRRAIV